MIICGCRGDQEPSPFKPFDLLGTEGTTNGRILLYFATTGFLTLFDAPNIIKFVSVRSMMMVGVSSLLQRVKVFL